VNGARVTVLLFLRFMFGLRQIRASNGTNRLTLACPQQFGCFVSVLFEVVIFFLSAVELGLADSANALHGGQLTSF
jgi:hypothetical protein